MAICPSCGEENPDRFRLCGFCGTPLHAAEPAREIRKTVTIVFSDLVGSTAIGERLDSESLRAVMSRYFDVMREELERHGGTVEKFIGDAVMAVFGLPHLHEDDAERAVRAAAGMQAALAGLNAELHERFGVTLQNRTGVNTGEVVSGDPAAGQRLVTGDAVNVAARLEQAAGTNEVLIGPLTRDLVEAVADLEPVEPLALKGKSEPMPAFRLMGMRAASAVPVAASPLVGRAEELVTLRGELDAAVASGSTRLVKIVAAAGAGKSRLVAEFLGTVPDGTTVTRGRCLSYGQGITFWPIAEALRDLAGVLDDDPLDLARAKLDALAEGDTAAAERAAAAVGLTDAAYPVDELFWGLRRVLTNIAARGPLVVAFEDLHWAEPTMLDLVDHLAATAAPLLLLCTARDELAEDGDGWATQAGGTTIELDRLSADEAAELAAALVGSAVPPATLRTIVETAGGNPLFLEQMLAMIQDAPGGDVAVPPTIHALLSARLDRLDGGQREVVGTASVVGQVFPEAAVVELVPDARRPAVPEDLGGLVRRRLVQSHPAVMTAGAAYTFQHILIRDAAYAGLLKRHRAELHERFVAWADEVNGDRAGEYEEILGYHLEQAHAYLAELGPLDDRGRAIGRQASERLRSAGHRAFARGDMPAAANLLRRAAVLLPAFDQDRLDLLPDLGEALMDVGEFAEAREVLRQAIAAGNEAGDHRLRADASLVLVLVEFYAEAPPDWSQRAARVANAAIPIFELLGDDAGLAKAWRVLGRSPRDGPSLRGGRPGRRAGDGSRPSGGRPAPGAPQRVVVRGRGGVRADAGRGRDRGVLADRRRCDRRPAHGGARARRPRPPRGDARRVRPRPRALRPGPLDAGGARKQRARRRHLARVGRRGAPRRQPCRSRAAHPARRRRARADGRRRTSSARRPPCLRRRWRRRAATPRPRSWSRPASGERATTTSSRTSCSRACARDSSSGPATSPAESPRPAARSTLLENADAPVTRAEALLALAEACDAAGDTDGATAVLDRAAAECRAKGYVVAERRARRLVGSDPASAAVTET